eukprot:TRINITY_DN6553_c0_g1_i3.p4 TRINITY_DN6553_c0_g1~~TRINITY_DN6553_c0_g1_i3.p4  ORF type:complete len:175 (-),score=6.91 TRINITY_DN6553_c0_g1_i3:260-784(-)
MLASAPIPLKSGSHARTSENRNFYSKIPLCPLPPNRCPIQDKALDANSTVSSVRCSSVCLTARRSDCPSVCLSTAPLPIPSQQRCPTQDKVLDDSVSVEFAFKVKEWPTGLYVQQKQTASHTFKGLFRERGYRSLLNPWNEVMKDNNKYFRNGVMHLRADLRVIQPGESLCAFE